MLGAVEKGREHGLCPQVAHFLKVNYKVKVNLFTKVNKVKVRISVLWWYGYFCF